MEGRGLTLTAALVVRVGVVLAAILELAALVEDGSVLAPTPLLDRAVAVAVEAGGIQGVFPVAFLPLVAVVEAE